MPPVRLPPEGSTRALRLTPGAMSGLLAISLLASACSHPFAFRKKPQADPSVATPPAVASRAVVPPRTAASLPSAVGPAAERKTPGRRVGNRVGTIHTVGSGSQFVLVEIAGLDSVAFLGDGQELRSASADPSASNGVAVLRVARERRPPFIVADVLSGQPQAGDEVYVIQGGIGPVVAPAPTPIENPALVPMPLFPPNSRPMRGTP